MLPLQQLIWGDQSCAEQNEADSDHLQMFYKLPVVPVDFKHLPGSEYCYWPAVFVLCGIKDAIRRELRFDRMKTNKHFDSMKVHETL